MNRHIDYIHYNPVKHGFLNNPSEYDNSSFKVYVRVGRCGMDWGVKYTEETGIDFGE
jgi:putative transposase